MGKLSKRRAQRAGQPPGYLSYSDEKTKEEVKISYIDYDKDNYTEKEIEDIEESFKFKETDTTTWINIEGLSDIDIITKLSSEYNIHPLVQEDIFHAHQRPKVEEHENFLYIVAKMLKYNEAEEEIESEQISLVLGDGFVITFQEKPGDVFDPIRQRLKNEKGKIRNMKADYLAYALIDVLVDNYFIILEKISDRIEDIEEELVKNPSEDTLHSLYDLKNEMIFLRKSVWPLREVVNRLEKDDNEFMGQTVKLYLRDVYDHTIQVIETVETLRDMLGSMLDIYLSSISNKMNEVMKVLTIIATIFIPLTFIAGIYGMNFEYMPELTVRNGYFIILIVMLIIGLYMIYFFKKKKWL
ncbi:MAG: magnesium/cobalt transporter CorA [Halanaerobiales bacterium]|nr:magnesium/cobalt transporter CorA [Halanaerobiales bacterium]